MLAVNFFNFLKGYIVIIVEGYFIEKFINICTRRQIYLWDIYKMGNCTMRLKISIKGFKLLRPVARKTRCRVRILKKRGIPFIIHRYRKRKTFIVGIIIFIILLWYMTSFIWVIEIKGNDTITSEQIANNLRQCGLEVGISKFDLDVDKIQNHMILSINELSWIGIEIKGTKAIIEVKERKMPPKIIPQHIPCNIIAKKDGVIKSIVTKNGCEVVKLGDTVKKGQLLISGIIDSKDDGGARYVHSCGTVIARTWNEEAETVELVKTQEIKTKNSITKHRLKIFGFEINLFINSSIPYENYDKIITNKELVIGKDYVLPISIESVKYEELQIKNEKIEMDDAVNEYSDILLSRIKDKLSEDTEILNTNVEYAIIDENNLLIKLTAECLEQIGKQEEIIVYSQID